MEITQVDYQKLVSLGNYENERVGAWCNVAEGENPADALHALTEWVEGQLEANRQIRTSLAEAESDLYKKRAEIHALERDIAVAQNRWDRLQAWFKENHIPLPSRWANVDIPF